MKTHQSMNWANDEQTTLAREKTIIINMVIWFSSAVTKIIVFCTKSQHNLHFFMEIMMTITPSLNVYVNITIDIRIYRQNEIFTENTTRPIFFYGVQPLPMVEAWLQTRLVHLSCLHDTMMMAISN